jgi:hypothetical protein
MITGNLFGVQLYDRPSFEGYNGTMDNRIRIEKEWVLENYIEPKLFVGDKVVATCPFKKDLQYSGEIASVDKERGKYLIEVPILMLFHLGWAGETETCRIYFNFEEVEKSD